MPLTWPAGAPPAFHLLAKPTGAICNLDCEYCFFLSKESLYPGSPFRMSDDLLESYIRQLVEAHGRSPEVTIAWQGGEPTLMGVEFFRRSVEVVQHYLKPGQRVAHTIQTNATLIDDAWAELFTEHGFLVGVSIDGPREVHDRYRVDKGGKPTFDRVMRGLSTLKEHGVDWNALTTVHAANHDRGLEVYRFLRDDLGATFTQFIPIIERATSDTLQVASQGWGAGVRGRPLYLQEGDLVTDRSVPPDGFGRFLIDVFEEWVRHDVGDVFVQMFDVALAQWVGVPPSLCVHAETCGAALALEHNGDVYSCDHFVEPAHLLGNIGDRHLLELVALPQQQAFGQAKRDTLPRFCRECDVRFACHGGCPKDRFTRDPYGEPGLNYLCPSYKAFFTHVDAPMRRMADLLRSGKDAPAIRDLYATKDAHRPRNSPCSCGNGRKWKDCHGLPAQTNRGAQKPTRPAD